MLSNQRSLYRKSRYNELGLQLWLDTTAVENFTVDENGFCSLAKERTQYKREFSQPDLLSQPLYVQDAMNGLPALRFDGVDDFMLFADPTMSWLNNSSFTFFIVATKTPELGLSPIIGGQSVNDNENFGMGYLLPNTFRVIFGGDDANAIVPSSAPGEVELYTIKYDTSNNSRIIYINGEPLGIGAATAPVSNMVGQALGRYLSEYGQFDLGDIIVYSRALNDYERNVVERDLSSKWQIG